MSFEALKKCPVCDGDLVIDELHCVICNTKIKNSFVFSKLSKLSKEDATFVELFVMSRGSIKDMEKHLNLSYPTVRSRLDSIIHKLAESTDSSYSDKSDILDALENGKLSASEAAEHLRLLNFRGNKNE